MTLGDARAIHVLFEYLLDMLIFVWLVLAVLVSSLIGFVGIYGPSIERMWAAPWLPLDWLLLWMAIFVPYPSHSLFLIRRHPHAQGQPSPSPSIKSPCSSSRTITHLSSPTTTPTVTEEDDSSPPPPPATAGCQTCGREEIERGCNGEGRIQGGIATVPGFGWWPIKAYRPCPGFTASGGRYRRRGQSMDDVASGRGRRREMPLESTVDEAKSSSKKKMKQQSS